MCVCVRERERERERHGQTDKNLPIYFTQTQIYNMYIYIKKQAMSIIEVSCQDQRVV